MKLLATEGLVDLPGFERHACELAAARMTEREFARLKQLHDRMAAFHRAETRRGYFRLRSTSAS